MTVLAKTTIKNNYLTGLTPSQTNYHDWIDSYLHVQEMAVHNVKAYGAVGNDNEADDDAPAIQQAIDDALAVGAGGAIVYAPPGTYYIGSPITFDRNNFTGNRPKIWFVGAGSWRTVFRPQSAMSTATPMMRCTNGDTGTGIFEFCRFAHFGLWNQALDAGECVQAFDLPFLSHSVLEDIRVLGGESGIRVGYQFTNTYRDILVQDQSKFGLLFANTVCNQVGLERVTMLNCADAGLYSLGSNGINFFNCNAENIGKFGYYLNRSNGASFDKCYWETGGLTKHTWTSHDSTAFATNWQASACIALAGSGAATESNLPTDCGHLDSSKGISVRGCYWGPTSTPNTQAFVAGAGFDGLTIGEIGVGDFHDLDINPLLETYGDFDLDKNAEIFGSYSRSKKNCGVHRRVVAPDVHDEEHGDRFSVFHRFHMKNSKPIEIDHTSFANITAGGTYLDSGKPYRDTGRNMFWLDHTATGGWFGDTTAFQPGQFPELANKYCAVELGFFPVADRFSATAYDVGVQTWAQTQDAGGLTSVCRNNPGVAGVKAEDVQTTGDMTSGTQTVTVTDGSEITVGMPLAIAGAGSAGSDLTTFVSGVSGNVITVDGTAGTSVSGANVIQPHLQVTAVIIKMPHDVANVDLRVRLIKVAGTDNQRVLVAWMRIREIGTQREW